MHGERDEGRERRLEKAASVARHFCGRSEQRAGSSGAERHDNLRFYRLNPLGEPHAAREHFFAIRFLVNPSFAARLPFEMLDRVGEINLSWIEASFLECLTQQLPRWTDEWLSGEVFLIPRLLPNQHHARA